MIWLPSPFIFKKGTSLNSQIRAVAAFEAGLSPYMAELAFKCQSGGLHTAYPAGWSLFLMGAIFFSS
jgi:hypothetical protein